jgi:hypothetical protein
MSYEFCPKCGTKINGAVGCKHCGRMPTPYWRYRTPPPRGLLKKLKAEHEQRNERKEHMQLYSVTTIVKEYSGRKDVPFQWFFWGSRIVGVEDNPMSRFGVPYADLIENYSADNPYGDYAKFAVDECFTAHEALALKEYLDREHGDAGVTTIKQVCLPLPNNIAGYSATPVGGGCDFYMLHQEQNYSLPFRADAYFDLGNLLSHDLLAKPAGGAA